MSSQLISFLLITALLDSLNPATIITQLLLLIKTRSSKISLFFIVSTYVTYLAAGFLLFFGVATPLKKWLSSIRITANIWTTTLEIIIIILALFYLSWSFSAKKSNRKTLVKSLTPWAVILLGFGSTLSDVPTAIPYFAFIAKMEHLNVTMPSSILFFSLYTFIYISPLLIIQFVFIKNESFVVKHSFCIERWTNVLGKFIIRLLLIAGISFLIADVVRYFLRLSSLWLGFVKLNY